MTADPHQRPDTVLLGQSRASERELTGAASVYLNVFRPIAPLVCAGAFLALYAVTRDSAMLRVAGALGVSALLALCYRMLAEPGRVANVLVGSVLLDALVVGWLVAQMPRPSDFSVAYLWSIGIAALLLPRGWAAVVTLEAATLAVAVPMLAGEHRDLPVYATNVVIFLVVGAALAVARGEEARTRRSLERSERQLAEAQRVAQIGSWEWRPDTGDLYWSDEMYRIRGVDPRSAPVSFSTYLEQLVPEERERVDAALRRTLEEGVPYDLDISFTRPSGEPGLIHARGALVVAEDGNEWMVGTAQDVTELRAEQVLREQFAATASHELRTPATVVSGFAQTLRDRWDELDDPMRQALVEQICRGGERLNRLIEDILQVSRIESGHLKMRARPISIAELVEEAAADIANPRVRAEIDDEVRDALVLADPERQRQVLNNLVLNALAYSDDPSPVVLRVAAEDEHAITVRVEDQGVGVPVTHRERIFERFVRLHADARGTHGTGLGLHITRELVQLHGGRIWVQDGPGGIGATFAYTVPRA